IEGRPAEIDAAERDLAALRVVLPSQQLRQSRLARASCADERDVLADLELDRHAVHDRRVVGVPESHVAQRERSAGCELDRAAALDDCVRSPKQADDLAQGSESLAELAQPLAE